MPHLGSTSFPTPSQHVRLPLMPTITVPLRERSYSIHIEPGALDRLANSNLPNEIAVLSNETVAPLYADALCERLQAGGKRRVLQFNAPDGEAYKNLEWVSRAYD